MSVRERVPQYFETTAEMRPTRLTWSSWEIQARDEEMVTLSPPSPPPVVVVDTEEGEEATEDAEERGGGRGERKTRREVVEVVDAGDGGAEARSVRRDSIRVRSLPSAWTLNR